MYFSVASRTTHANDTFFCFAIVSSVSYTSGGKLIDARTQAALSPRAAIELPRLDLT